MEREIDIIHKKDGSTAQSKEYNKESITPNNKDRNDRSASRSMESEKSDQRQVRRRWTIFVVQKRNRLSQWCKRSDSQLFEQTFPSGAYSEPFKDRRTYVIDVSGRLQDLNLLHWQILTVFLLQKAFGFSRKGHRRNHRIWSAYPYLWKYDEKSYSICHKEFFFTSRDTLNAFALKVEKRILSLHLEIHDRCLERTGWSIMKVSAIDESQKYII